MHHLYNELRWYWSSGAGAAYLVGLALCMLLAVSLGYFVMILCRRKKDGE